MFLPPTISQSLGKRIGYKNDAIKYDALRRREMPLWVPRALPSNSVTWSFAKTVVSCPWGLYLFGNQGQCHTSGVYLWKSVAQSLCRLFLTLFWCLSYPCPSMLHTDGQLTKVQALTSLTMVARAILVPQEGTTKTSVHSRSRGNCWCLAFDPGCFSFWEAIQFQPGISHFIHLQAGISHEKMGRFLQYFFLNVY